MKRVLALASSMRHFPSQTFFLPRLVFLSLKHTDIRFSNLNSRARIDRFNRAYSSLVFGHFSASKKLKWKLRCTQPSSSTCIRSSFASTPSHTSSLTPDWPIIYPSYILKFDLPPPPHYCMHRHLACVESGASVAMLQLHFVQLELSRQVASRAMEENYLQAR
jgi:hypothetical protein